MPRINNASFTLYLISQRQLPLTFFHIRRGLLAWSHIWLDRNWHARACVPWVEGEVPGMGFEPTLFIRPGRWCHKPLDHESSALAKLCYPGSCKKGTPLKFKSVSTLFRAQLIWVHLELLVYLLLCRL